MTKLIIDIQGLYLDRKFIVKELAAYDGFRICHIIFKSPYNYENLTCRERKNQNYLEQNYHKIHFNEGFASLNELPNILKTLTEDVDKVYCKGEQKYQFLKNYIDAGLLYEYPKTQEPVLSKYKSKVKCFFHLNQTAHCALKNVFLLWQYLH